MLIDVHTHIVPERLPDFSGRVGGDRWPCMEPTDPCQANVMIAGKNFRTVTDQCWSVARRAEDMEAEHVTRQVLSPMPMLFSYGFEPQDTLEFCRYVNETIAGMVAEAPERFYGLGIVPLQDPELAAKEIERVLGMGLQGVEVGTNVNGTSLGDPVNLPFFREAELQGLPIFVHAQHPTGKERFIGAPLLENLIGFPQENVLAAATLITGGVMERCPSLRVLFSHGGSGFAIVLARLEQGWRSMNDFLPRSPREYTRNFYFDTLVYDATAVRFLIDSFGPGRVMVGSDYPFAIREVPPGKHLGEVKGLSAADRGAIQAGTCLDFLGVGKD